MNTLVVPCAGRSNRFPNMKPKWLLTHPDGELMIQKALSGLNLDVFDRIIFTIVREHADKYEAEFILQQIYSENKKVEICVLDDFTKSASETVFLTLEKKKVTGSFVIKDCDNLVQVKLPAKTKNSIVAYDLHLHPDISNVPGKSFLLMNEQNIIQDIIEKKVVSNIICLGVYSFEKVDDFKTTYLELVDKRVAGEMFVSHVISYILSKNKAIFEAVMAEDYEDWGTINEWKDIQKKHSTYFVDVDGVILKNSGKLGKVNWSNNRVTIEENVRTLVGLQKDGAQIVITTSRTEAYRKDLEKILADAGLVPHAIIMGLHHSARVIINDFAPTNPYPSGIAISLPQ